MAAQPPTRLGPYDIVAPLGTGGMGEVYRARDPRLNREVAIKVLAHAGTDPVRRRRFIDEAQAASALNHPNILTVYDVGTDDEGTPYIVSELVEGESLRARLTHAPLAVRDALDLGVQMAEGLAAAHQAGIVHRDFKPENVMVTREGRVKILDFGLALVGMRDGVPASEVDVTLTATGVIVGTVPYMSPEQARGATVDYRTDQFSLGLTLYELATGRRAFQAESAAQTLAAIIEDDPEPITKLNARVPAPVRWVIERCLAKDARQRYDATADLARELRTLRDRLNEFASSTEVAPTAPRRRQRGLFAIAGALAAAAGALALLMWSAVANPGPDLSAYRLTPIATDPGYQGSPAWSPDGRTLAYIAEVDGVLQIFTRALNSPMRQQVTRGSFDAQEPFWSPDGTRLYYLSPARDRYGLWSTSVSGGQPEIVMENVTRATLSPDGRTLAFFRSPENAAGTTLWLSSPPGAPPVQYTRPPLPMRLNDEATLHFSPDGTKLGAWLQRSVAETGSAHPEFWVLPMQKGVPHVAPSSLNFPENTSPDFSWLTDSRRIVSALPFPKPGVHLWLTDTERSASRLLTITGNVEGSPAISPDGTRLALTFQQADYDVYQLTIDHPSPSVLLATSRNEMDPVSSPSGDQMVFTSDRSGHDEIWLRSQRGDLERPLVTQTEFGTSQTFTLGPTAFSPDGQHIAYNRFSPEGARIWISAIAGGPPAQLAAGNYWQDAPSWSPDGTWIAYVQSTGVHYVGGEWQLVKMRVGTRTSPEVLASDLIPDYYAHDVKWAPDNTWIAYNGRGGLSVVSPDGKSARVLRDHAWLAFAWSADSRRLYGIRPSEDSRQLMLTSVDIRSGAEHVLNANFMPLPLSRQPVRGFARASATTFITSIPRVRSDIWLLEGFDPQSSLRDRLGAFFFRHY